MSDVPSRRIVAAAASGSPTDRVTDPAADDTLWASIAHLGGVLWFLPSLVIYLREKARASVARQESKEALNWQITFTAGYLVLMLVGAIVGGVLLLTPAGSAAGIVWVIPMALYVVNVALSIRAGLRVNAGGAYRYPVAIRFVK